MKKIILILGLMLLMSNIVSAALTDDLVSYWKFDETSGTVAVDELGKNNITLSSTNMIQSGGKINYGISNDGSSYYGQKAGTIGLTNRTHWTFAGWFRPNATNNSYLIMPRGDLDARLEINNNQFATMFYDGSERRVFASISLNEWQLIVGTYNGSLLTIYKNGVLANSSSLTSTPGAGGAYNFRVLSDLASGNRFNGFADEFAIWNRSLSADEISDLYNEGDGFQYPFTEEEPPAGDLTAVQYLYEIDYSGDKIYSYNCTTAWSSSSCVYTNSIDTVGSSPFGLTWNNNGTKIYVADRGYNRIDELSCTSAWVLSTCNSSGVNISAQDTDVSGIAWNYDGYKLYEVGYDTDLIYESACATAWDISSCTYSGINISTQDSVPTGINFKFDGTKLYEVGYNTNKIYQYSCSTPWDLSSCAYSDVNISTQDTRPTGISWGYQGKRLYEIGQYADSVNGSRYQYTCTTAWELSSCSYSSITNKTQDINPSGIFMSPLLNNSASSIVYNTVPDNDTHSNDPTISATFTPSDSDGNTLSCYLYVDNLSVNQSLTITSGTETTLKYTFSSSDTYSWFIACYDGYLYTIQESRTYIYDAIAPDIYWYTPSVNYTLASEQYQLNISVQDMYLYKVNISVFYPNDTLFHNNYSGEIDQEWYNVTDILNMTGQVQGWYTIKVSATDDHTYGKLDKLTKSALTDNIIRYSEPNGYLDVKFEMVSSDHKKKSVSVVQTMEDVKIYDKLKKDKLERLKPKENYVTEYKWSYDFIVPSNGDYALITLTTDGKFSKRENSGLAIHYIYAEKYYVDFEDATTIYVNGKPVKADVSVISETNNQVILKIEPKNKFKAGDEVHIDPVTGGLNTAIEYRTFYYNTAPVNQSSRINPTEPAPSNIIYGYCNVSDADNDNVSFNYIWYKDGVSISSGNYSVDIEVNDTDWIGSYQNSSYFDAGLGELVYYLDITDHQFLVPVSTSSAYWNVTYWSNDSDLIDITACLGDTIALNLTMDSYDLYCNGVKFLDNPNCLGDGCWINTLQNSSITWHISQLEENTEHLIANYTIPNEVIGSSYIFSCRGFDGLNYSSYMNSSAVWVNHTFNFIFRDEINQTIINTSTITVEFVSDDYIYNYTTSTGLLSIGDLNASNYTIRYYSADHGRKRTYWYAYEGVVQNNITLYLLLNSDSELVTVTVYDEQTLNIIPEAIVYLQRYYHDENAYKTVAMYESDVAGKVYFDVTYTTEKYKMLVDYPWLTNRLTTEGFYIEEDLINLYISLDAAISQIFFDKLNIAATLSYNPASEQFEASYTDASAVSSEVCLYLKTMGTYSKTIINTTCSTSSSATLIVSGVDINSTQTYYSVLTATISGEEQVLLTGWKAFGTEDMETGQYGVFLTIIIFIMFCFLSSFHLYTMIFAIAGIVLAKMTGLLVMDWGWIIGIWLSAVFLVLFMRMKK